MDEDTMAHLLKMEEEMRPQREFAEQLMKDNPSLPSITAIIMAGDKVSFDHSYKRMEEGEPFDKAIIGVGSYYKLEFMLKAVEGGFTTRSHLYEMLPEYWPMSDPDDTDPRFFMLWADAWWANGKKYIRDGKRLPQGKQFTVYRGQPEGARLGIAWSLDEDIARKFKSGAWARVPVKGGVVYKAKIRRKDIIAYLTGRHEQEIILNPLNLITED